MKVQKTVGRKSAMLFIRNITKEMPSKLFKGSVGHRSRKVQEPPRKNQETAQNRSSEDCSRKDKPTVWKSRDCSKKVHETVHPRGR